MSGQSDLSLQLLERPLSSVFQRVSTQVFTDVIAFLKRENLRHFFFATWFSQGNPMWWPYV